MLRAAVSVVLWCGVVRNTIHILRRTCDVLFKVKCNYSHVNCKNHFMVLQIIYIVLDSSTDLY